MADRLARVRQIGEAPLGLVIALAAALLVASLGLGLYNEHQANDEHIKQARVQAQILAGTVAAPLAFDDRVSAQEYVNALRADPTVDAAGAYDGHGGLAAGFHRGPGDLPPVNRLGPPQLAGGRLTVTAPVVEGGVNLGSVYLRVTTERLARRASRYLGIAAVLVMASLLVMGLGASNARLREAHRRLQQETRDREAVEAELRQSQKMEAMGQLTGGVAHDFNNLLMVASSGLDLMDRTSDPARRERLKDGIRQAIDRGAGLTQQLLAFARRTPLKAEVVDLAKRLAQMRNLLDRSLREDIGVAVSAAPDLWPVEIDPAQFEVALLNMAINARDAMPRGGRITIRLSNVVDAVAGERVRIDIEDTGEGMSPETISRIFEPFFTTKEVGKGTGLGLSQVYGFARSSGGEVQVRSALGQGTTLSMFLPRSTKAPAAAPLRAQAAAGQEPRSRRLLLVEDDDGVADLVGQMLVDLGYDFARAETAAAALEVLGADPAFDLVLSDMVMPGEMSGLDLARELARRWPALPVVLTTGYSASAAEATAEGLRLLVKPYRIEALAAELAAALGAAPR